LQLIVIPWAEFWHVDKVLEIISRFCATTLSAIGCMTRKKEVTCAKEREGEREREEKVRKQAGG